MVPLRLNSSVMPPRSPPTARHSPTNSGGILPGRTNSNTANEAAETTATAANSRIHFRGEAVPPVGGVVLRRRGAGVLTDVKGFVEGEAVRGGHLDASLGDFLAVHAQCPGPALRHAATVVLEVETERVLSGRQFAFARDPVMVPGLVR